MTYDLNNKHMGTKSRKLRRVTPIKNYIVDKIDGNQTIKRMCRYMTVTPSIQKGKTYDGKIVNQPDLVDSLKFACKRDDNALIKEQVLYNCAFTEDVLEERRLTIYVHCPRSTFNLNVANGRSHYGTEEVTGSHLFYIEIVYPLEYDSIQPYGYERSMEIACEICDMFDDLYVDKDLQSEVGAIRTVVEGEVLNERLSRSGYMVLSIPIRTTVFTTRTKVQE